MSSDEDRKRLARYFAALERVLGKDWLTRPHSCTVRDAVRAGRHVRLALPCIRLNCPNNLLGHLDEIGLPVLYHNDARGRLTCMLQLEDELTFGEVGYAIGISRQRVEQIVKAALPMARERARRLGVVSCPPRR